MLRLLPDTLEEVAQFTYRSLARDTSVALTTVPVLRGSALGLPAHVRSIRCTSDLQADAGPPDSPLLATIEFLAMLAQLGREGILPPSLDSHLVFAGDGFAHPDLHKSGGSGDVRHLWHAAREVHGAVVGVAGNHDRIGASLRDLSDFRETDGIHFLDIEVANVDGVRFAGVSGVIGDRKRPFRHAEVEFLAGLGRMPRSPTDVLVLHPGPSAGSTRGDQHEGIRALCAQHPGGIVAYGHNHVDDAIETLPSGAQFLNVHERVVILTHQDR